MNSATNPAKWGSLISIYANGIFCSNLPVSGLVTKTAQDMDTYYFAMSGSLPLPVEYSGPAPGIIDGICQFNIRLPRQVDPTITLITPDWLSSNSNTVQVHSRY